MSEHFDEARHPRDPQGRFVPRGASESDVELDVESRVATIAAGGHVGAATATKDVSGKTREVDRFRDTAALVAEHGHAAGDYPKMDLSERRRTYPGPTGDLTMPSRTAVLRTGDSVGGTFDVPVEHGGTVSWMRCTPVGGGRWEVEPAAAHTPAQTRTAEAVCAVLESRRPTTALTAADATALAERRRERMEARGARDHDITSSWIRSTGYQQDAQLMVMRTRDTATKAGEHRPGRVYGFRDVPAEHYQALTKSDRPGAVFNELIKGQHERVSVDQCGSCGAFHATGGTAHVCSGGNRTTARPGTRTAPDTGVLGRLRRLRSRA